MNRIDRRFLEYSPIVHGIRNNPPEDVYYSREQFIVGSTPTGAFEGANPNAIAYHKDDTDEWKFITPVAGAEVFDVCTDEFLRYDSNNWVSCSNGNLLHNIKILMPGYNTLPEAANLNSGDCAFNLTETRPCYVDSNNEWSYDSIYDGYEIIVRLPDKTWKKFYFENLGDGYWHETPLKDGLYVVKNGEFHKDNDTFTFSTTSGSTPIVYYYNSDIHSLCKVYPTEASSAGTSSGKEFYTETHTLTAEEVTNKAFTLAYSVESGEETNILCSISGIIQPAGVAFEVSGNTLNWGSKTLDGSLNAGDVFVVHYVKAAE